MSKELIPEELPDFLKWLSNSTFHTRELAWEHHLSRGIESYLIQGAILCTAEAKEDWKKAGCKNHFEWVENEKRISRTQAQRMQLIWKVFGAKITEYYDSIKKIPFTNLYELARVIHLVPAEKKIELLENAAHHTERAFKDTIREIEGKTPTDTCDHINTITVVTTLEVCRKCTKVLSRKEEKNESGSKAD